MGWKEIWKDMDRSKEFPAHMCKGIPPRDLDGSRPDSPCDGQVREEPLPPPTRPRDKVLLCRRHAELYAAGDAMTTRLVQEYAAWLVEYWRENLATKKPPPGLSKEQLAEINRNANAEALQAWYRGNRPYQP